MTHAYCLLSQAKDVAENTFLLALDSMNLSQYRSSLRYVLILNFFKLVCHVRISAKHEMKFLVWRSLIVCFLSSGPSVNSAFKQWTSRGGVCQLVLHRHFFFCTSLWRFHCVHCQTKCFLKKINLWVCEVKLKELLSHIQDHSSDWWRQPLCSENSKLERHIKF